MSNLLYFDCENRPTAVIKPCVNGEEALDKDKLEEHAEMIERVKGGKNDVKTKWDTKRS